MTPTAKRTALFIGISTILLAGCGGGMGGCGDKSNDQTVVGNDGIPMQNNESAERAEREAEREGPQYQKPTMDVLLGKPQHFPAKFPAKRYPNSRVVMALTRPNLKPGETNEVLLSSTDDQPTVARYYYGDLLKEGWKPVYSNGNSAFSQIKYQKGDQQIEVRIFPDPHGGQQVQLLNGPFQADKVYQSTVPNQSDVGEN